MTIQPGDDTSAGKAGRAGRGHLRASHADREQVISTLKAAYVRGMLAKDELDARVGQAFASRVYADLDALTADLPAGLAAAQPPKPARTGGAQPVLRPAQITVGATVLYAGAWAYELFLSPNGIHNPSFPLLITDGLLVYLGVLAIAVAVALENRRHRRSGGRLSREQAPAAAGQASRRPAPAGPYKQLPPAGHDLRHRAEAVQDRCRRTLLPVWRARISVPCAR